MTPQQRLNYLDVALRVNNIQLSDSVKVKFIKCLELVDKSKGKATLDEVLVDDKLTQ